MRTVKLIHCSGLDIAELAARTCTATTDKMSDTWMDCEAFLMKLVKQGHMSVFEHVNYTFSIKGVSRALLQELARHRHISLSVESTRWALKRIMASNPEMVLPKSLEEVYVGLQMEWIRSLLKEGIPNDEVKYLIPECLPTNLVLTLNLRELIHIYRLRTSPRALKEFHDLMIDIAQCLPNPHFRILTNAAYPEHE
jgi:thymidylate synthase (FAD)